MKRRAFKLLVFLLLGAIINVAVAWGCAAVSRTLTGPLEWYDQPGCHARVFRQPGACYVSTVRHQNVQASLNSTDSSIAFWLLPGAISTSDWKTGDYKMEWRSIECFGWPLPSMQNETERTLLSKIGKSVTNPPRWGWQTTMTKTVSFVGGHSAVATHAIVLPFRPFAPGFAINTIFYAAIVWMMFVAPGVIRRHGRRKRGQCAACGYSMRGSAESGKCPECGATTIKQKAESRKQKAETQKAEME